MSGRGAGKTRGGAEWIRSKIENEKCRRVALVARTAADVRDVMIEGPSGLLACCPPWNRPDYEPSKRRLTWPNGALAIAYSADKPDLLRGPQHDGAWVDELATWRYTEAWDNLLLGLRMGDDPRVVVTTTPKPRNLIRKLIKHPTTKVTHASTYDNLLFLAPAFADQIIARYKGTRLGRQEIEGILLEDVEGALWTRAMVDASHILPDKRYKIPEMARMVVAIDPAVTSGEDADDTGIIVAGLGVNGRGYVWADYTCHLSPGEWGARAVNAYHEHRADRIIGEINNGGDLVEMNIRTVDPNISYKGVHASRGKRVRAEPVAALYEQGRIQHVNEFDDLEDQMCNFAPDQMDNSPDRVDALVWAFTELMLQEPEPTHLSLQIVDIDADGWPV